MSQPKTSISANTHMEKSGKKVNHRDIILNALKVKRSGQYEQIAGFCSLTSMQVIRRLSELANLGLIRKTGKFERTFSKQLAEVWEIVEEPIVNSQNTLF